MPEMNIPSEFEQQLRQALDVPEPDSAALSALRKQFITQGAAQLRAPNGTAKASAAGTNAGATGTTTGQPVRTAPARSFRAWFSQSWTWKFALVLLVVLVMFASFSPQIVNALRGLFGYIPAVGVVDQSAEVRVLDEPVQVTHGEIPLTVERAFVTSEKTVVVYQYQVPPWDGMKYRQVGTLTPDRPALLLPDGSRLEVVVGRRQPADDGGIRYALEFGPLSADVSTAILYLDRLAGMPPEISPKDWAIPLRFKPGTPSEILFPVTVYEPTQTPTTAPSAAAEPTPAAAAPAYGASILLEKSVELPDGYLLMGSLRWSDPSIGQDVLSLGMPVITDASGQTIDYEVAPLDTYPQPGELRQNWALKIPGKDFAAPLRLEFYITLLEAAGQAFPFDPGPNLQHGQTYDLNIDLPVNAHQVKIVSARYENPAPNIHYFLFTLTADTYVIGARIIDPTNPPMGGGGGSSGIPLTAVPFSSGLFVEGALPQGPLTLQITSLDVLIPGDWVITWSPEQ